MAANNKQTPESIGFLTVCDFAEQGLFGGYLVLNLAGRPLEFHCTAPVRPNRAQEILYGPTLRPYLYGEQIGRVLLERAKASPLLVFTDEEPALSVCTSASVPVVLVELDDDDRRDDEAPSMHRIDNAHPGLAPSRPQQLQRFRIGDQQLAVLKERQDDQAIVAAQWESHANEFDLSEPFGRIVKRLKKHGGQHVDLGRSPQTPICDVSQVISHRLSPAHERKAMQYSPQPLDIASRTDPRVAGSSRESQRSTAALDVKSTDLTVPASIFATGWATLLNRPPKVVCESMEIDAPLPGVASVKIRRPTIKVNSFTFPESPDWAPKIGRRESGDATKKDPTRPKPKRQTQTRIAPPGDVIKLQDRLYYVLQPSLESLVTSNELVFPFEPFPYQFQGIAFLYSRYSAVLADEMGLGKTMQAISTIRLLLCSGELRRVLLVCPKPLVSNWKREFALWAPEVPIAIIEGDQAKRKWQWTELDVAVRIANYELLMRDRDLVTDPDQHFDLVVLDEAQRIKNRSSTTSQVVREIPRTRNWAMTGTPVENSPDDLVGIFEFLSKGYLSLGMKPRAIAKATRDHILRRTKDKVLTDMPPKLYRDAELDLTPEQWESYQSAENEGVLKLEHMGAEITIQHVFELVLRLKQVCNFDPSTGASCKIERLEADIEEVAASGQKAIIFSQWVHCLEKLRDRLDRFGTLEYHGKIPHKRREGVIDQFKNDPSKHVILMSYGAGSVGLNLQFCRYVFLFDRWWNPAIEDQAINRAHRIGAAGSVTVTRMLTLGTIEERINQILEEKREMFDAIFSENGGVPKSAGLTQDEIFGLFNLRTPKGPIAKIA